MALCQRCICRYCRRNVGVFFLRGLGVALRRHERTCEAARHFLNQEAADRAEEKGDAPSQVEPNVAPSRVDVVKQPDRPDDLDTCGPPSQPSRPAHKVYLYMYDLFGGRSIGRIFLGKKLQAVWQTSIVVEWPNNCCELWYDNRILRFGCRTRFHSDWVKQICFTSRANSISYPGPEEAAGDHPNASRYHDGVPGMFRRRVDRPL